MVEAKAQRKEKRDAPVIAPPGKNAIAPAAISRPPTEVIELKIDETSIPFHVAKGDGNVFFSLGVRKSGSTMLHKIVNFLAMQSGVNLVDVPGSFFRKGFNYGHWARLDLEPMVRPGNLYTGFRAFPVNLGETPSYRDALKVFMFRDPRDALVSQYFSDAFSHSLPEEGGKGRDEFLEKREAAQATDINEWVVGKVGGLRRTLLDYQPILADPKALVLRYEDYVFQKRRLIRKVCEHFGWEVAPKQIDKLLADIDIVPDTEDKNRFVRKAVPGDHVAKLDAQTIRRLNHRLGDVLKMYDY